MFNSKNVKTLSVGLSAIALSVTVGYINCASADQIKATVSKPAIRTEYKSTDSIQLDGSVALTNGNRKISVSLRDSDLRQTLRMIADKAGLNIIFHSSVDGTVTLDLVNVTLNDAFKMIMQASDISYVLEKDTLLVMSKDASMQSDIAKQNMMVIPVKYADASKVADFLNNNIFSINRPGLSNNKIVVTNPATNELVLFGTKSDFAMAQKIIAKIDVKPKTTSYKVNHTTPKEMADMICKSLFPGAGAEGGGGSDSGGLTGGAADVGGGDLGGGGGGGGAKAIELGAGKVACTLKGSASSGAKLTSLGDTALTVMYFPQTGVINVTGGSESQTELISEFIKDNDRKQPQAYMEMQVIELNETGSKTFNNTWNMWSPFFSAGFGNTGLVSNPLHPTFLSGNGYDVMEDDNKTVKYHVGKPKGPMTISYNINYLIENGKGRILANPKIIVTNGQQSTIDLTSDYIQSTEAQIMGTAGLAGGVQKTYTIEKDNGMSIGMTPFISPDGYVTLNMQPKYATIKEQVMDNYVDEEGNATPIIAATLLQRRNLDLSNVRIKDGETLVLGGLIQETENKKVQKMPFLGDLPYIGSLFRNTTTTNEKSELVIMVTPRIIKDTEDFNQTDNL